jgi:hypothetical protein
MPPVPYDIDGGEDENRRKDAQSKYAASDVCYVVFIHYLY